MRECGKQRSCRPRDRHSNLISDWDVVVEGGVCADREVNVDVVCVAAEMWMWKVAIVPTDNCTCMWKMVFVSRGSEGGVRASR